MRERNPRRWFGLMGTACTLVSLAGCVDLSGDDLEDILDELGDLFDREFSVIQAVDPRTVVLPAPLVDRGQTVVIQNNVTIINDVRTDLVGADLADINIFWFENLTGLDGFYVYLADGIEQSVFVLDGEALALEYPCLGSIELVSEEYYDPFTGEFVDFFDIADGFFENGFDFFCGEALIFTFDADGVLVEPAPIDLTP